MKKATAHAMPAQRTHARDCWSVVVGAQLQFAGAMACPARRWRGLREAEGLTSAAAKRQLSSEDPMAVRTSRGHDFELIPAFFKCTYRAIDPSWWRTAAKF